jgi:hypothetical protein
MKRIAILAGLVAGVLAGPALAATLLTPPVTMGDNIRLRCSISNPKEGTVCSVNAFGTGSTNVCHSFTLGAGQGYVSPQLATEGSYYCRFSVTGMRSNFVAAGIVDTSANVPLAVLPAD